MRAEEARRLSEINKKQTDEKRLNKEEGLKQEKLEKVEKEVNKDFEEITTKLIPRAVNQGCFLTVYNIVSNSQFGRNCDYEEYKKLLKYKLKQLGYKVEYEEAEKKVYDGFDNSYEKVEDIWIRW